MIEQLPSPSDRVLAFRLSGKVHDEDYKTFVPIVDAAGGSGKIRILVEFHDFRGWDAGALWDDIKFATRHCTSFDRVALVGDKAWERWMAKVCGPFTMAKVRYFDAAEIGQAWDWIGE